VCNPRLLDKLFDVDALQDGIIGHVVVDVDAWLLADHLAILVEDVEDAWRASGDEDALMIPGAVQVVMTCLVLRSTTPIHSCRGR
jgi:hypothetical protein